MAADTLSQPTSRRRPGSEPWTSLAAWAADELRVRLSFDGEQYQIELPGSSEPEPATASESAVRRSWFRRRQPVEPTNGDNGPGRFVASTPGGVLAELLRRLGDRDTPALARPIEQPEAVHELSARLFSAYHLGDGGRLHLAGCHFEDVPLVRLTSIDHDDEQHAPEITHRYFDELGEPIPWDTASELGIDRVAPLVDPAPRLDPGRLERMLVSAGRAFGAAPPVLATIVWAKRASGLLRFDFGGESLDAPFEGWARTLAAPPATCPATGVETFRLGATSEGQIAAEEAIAVSDVSGQRRLASELTRCAATGKLAEQEHLGRCQATDQPVLTDELSACERCGLRVAPAAVRGGGCAACLGAVKVDIDPNVWTAVLTKHPKLTRHVWRTSRAGEAYLLEKSGWLRRRVVTIDAESLAVTHAAEGSRFSSVWRSIPTTTYD